MFEDFYYNLQMEKLFNLISIQWRVTRMYVNKICLVFRCGAPIEMEGQTLYDIHKKKSIMRCLDIYGNRPERDGAILVGLFIGKSNHLNCPAHHCTQEQSLFCFCENVYFWNNSLLVLSFINWLNFKSVSKNENKRYFSKMGWCHSVNFNIDRFLAHV